MKNIIVILLVCMFTFCSCCKTEDPQPTDSNATMKSSKEAGDSQNPFKILGEVKSAKFVIPSSMENQGPIEIDIENPGKWLELLFVEKEDGVAECGYYFDIIFTTSSGENAVHISPVQSILGDYTEGVPRIVYCFSAKVYDEIYNFLKSIIKPSEPNHPNNLTAGEMMIVFFQHINTSRFQEGLKLMKNLLDSNDVKFERRKHLEDLVRKYYVE